MKLSKRLKAWRDFRELSLDAAGALVMVKGVTWRSWEQGDDVPRQHYREALEIVTGIPAAEWQTDKERDVIDHARTAAAELAAASVVEKGAA